jgi:hypothetical protein
MTKVRVVVEKIESGWMTIFVGFCHSAPNRELWISESSYSRFPSPIRPAMRHIERARFAN